MVRGQKFFLFYGYNYCDVLVTNKRIVLGDSYTKYNGADIVFYNQEDYKINSSIELLKTPYYLDSFYKGEGKTYLKIKSDSFNIRNEKVSISNEIIFKILSDIK